MEHTSAEMNYEANNIMLFHLILKTKKKKVFKDQREHDHDHISSRPRKINVAA